ncbi:MAG: 4Fe-4S dicluster domain-containing protein [Candidatus Sigynarchaeota archaeon]
MMSDLEFKRQIYESYMHSAIRYCYQCSRCDENCPVHAVTAAYSPRQNILRSLLGINFISADDRLAIYGCTVCDTCDEVCPNKIPLTHIFAVLKNMAAAKNISPDSFKGQGKAVHDNGTAIPISPPIARRRAAMGLPEKYDLPVSEVQAVMKAVGFEDKLAKLTIEPKKTTEA